MEGFGNLTTASLSVSLNEENCSCNATTEEAIVVSGKEETLPQWFNVFYFCLRLVQGFVSFSANALTIVAIVKYPELRNSCTNFFVASLAVADALSGLLTYVQIITVYVLDRATQVWINYCYFEMFVSLVSVFGNLFGMLLITMDRYIYIQWPLKYYRLVTPGRALCAIGATWAFITCAFVFALVFGSHLVAGVPCRFSIVLTPDVYNYGIQLPFYGITCGIFLIYTLIGLLVIKLKRDMRKLAPADHVTEQSLTGNQAKKERKTIRVMALVLGVYIVCYIPTAIYHVIMKGRPQTVAVVVVSRYVVMVTRNERLLIEFLS